MLVVYTYTNIYTCNILCIHTYTMRHCVKFKGTEVLYSPSYVAALTVYNVNTDGLL